MTTNAMITPALGNSRTTGSALAEIGDAELVREFCETRSETAFAEIVSRHGSMVYRTCLRIARDPHEAEDAAQAAFIVLARRPAAAEKSLATWLYWVARNSAYEFVRARIRRTKHETAAASAAPVKVDPHAASEQAQLREELDRALASLAEPLREAVVLRYLEGWEQQEAARIAGCPQGTLGRRSMEGLQRLRLVLEKRGTLVTASSLLALFAHESVARAMPATLSAKLLAATQVQTGPVAAVAQGLLHALAWVNAKTAGAVVLILGLVAGAAAFGWQTWAATGTPEPSVPVEIAQGPLRTLVASKEGEPTYCPADMVAFSQRGGMLATGRCDGTVKIFDASTGNELAVLKGHTTRVKPVAFSADGKLVASGDYAGVVKLWDVATFTEVTTLRGHRSWIFDLAFSPDGHMLASASWDGSVELWDLESGEQTVSLLEHNSRVHTVAFAPDGSRIATGAADGTVRIWDRSAGTLLAKLDHGAGDVLGLAYHRDGRTLLSVNAAAGVWAWDAETGEELWRVEQPGVTSVAFAPCGDSFALVRKDGVTSLGNPRTGTIHNSVRVPGGFSATYEPDGRFLAVAGNGTITLLPLGEFNP